MPKTIDSNRSSLYYAQETSLKVLPGSPVWHPLEPNSYASFGGDLKTVMREPITASRQRNKGTVTDLDVKAGFNTDVTQSNLLDLLQGFFFAAAHEKPKTNPVKASGTTRTVTAIAAGSITLSGSIGSIPTNSLVLSKGNKDSQNNALGRVTGVAGSVVSTSPYKGGAVEPALVTDAAPAATSSLEVVGYALHGDVLLYGPGSTFGGSTVINPLLYSAADVDFTTLGLIPGEWVFLGDNNDALSDTGATEYNFLAVDPTVRNRAYARILSISATTVAFDLVVGAAGWALGGGAGGSCAVPASTHVSLYFGTVIKNEAVIANILRTTYTLQRYLGVGSNGDNLETVSGAVCNEVTLSVPSNNKLTADLSFVGMDNAQQNAATLPGTYKSLTSEAAINTAQSVYALFLYLIDPTVSAAAQAPLFGYATDEKIVINNNAKPNKAIGTVGAIEASVGNFDVSGSVTCYFDDIAAIQAVRNNADVGLTNIFAQKNAGFVIDLPLLTLALPGLKVEKDKPIMADISQNASPGVQNYTALYNNFAYLPDAALA